MILGRSAERDILLRELRTAATAPECKRVLSIHGEQGVGTSALCAWLTEAAVPQGLADLVLRADTSGPDCATLPGFIKGLLNSAVSSGEHQGMPEASELSAILESEDAVFTDDARSISIVSEAFFVDLLQSLHVFVRPDMEQRRENMSPKKVLIVIDRHEDDARRIDTWILDQLLVTAFVKSFGDFQYYQSPYIKPDTFVRQLLDIRVVVAGKVPLGTGAADKRWERWNSTIQPIHVKVFGMKELSLVLKEHGVVDPQQVSACFSATGGHPALVSSWLLRVSGKHDDESERSDIASGTESKSKSRITDTDTEGGAQEALKAEQLTKHEVRGNVNYLEKTLSPTEMRYLRVAAACRWVHGDVLRCFFSDVEERQRAEACIRHHWTCQPILHNGVAAFSLFPQARERLRGIATPAGEKSMQELDLIFMTYERVVEMVKAMPLKYMHLLRALACADAFDADNLPFSLFPGGRDDWEYLFSKYPHMFVSKEFTKSVAEPLRTLLRENNVYYAPRESEEWGARIRQSWQERSLALKAQLATLEVQLQEDGKRYREVQDDLIANNDLQHKTGEEIEDLRESISNLERSTPVDISNRDGVAAIVAGIAALLLSVPAFMAQGVVSLSGYEFTIQPALARMFVVFTVVFAALAAVYGARSFGLRKRRALYKRNLVKLTSLREQKVEADHRLRELQDEQSNQELNRKRLEDEIAQNQLALAHTNTMLLEPYVQI